MGPVVVMGSAGATEEKSFVDEGALLLISWF